MIFIKFLALNLEKDLFTPSHLKCLDDQILSYTAAEVCRNSYIQLNKFQIYPNLDPLISPLVVGNEVILIIKAYLSFFEL